VTSLSDTPPLAYPVFVDIKHVSLINLENNIVSFDDIYKSDFFSEIVGKCNFVEKKTNKKQKNR
jgi:hypothetical protein